MNHDSNPTRRSFSKTIGAAAAALGAPAVLSTTASAFSDGERVEVTPDIGLKTYEQPGSNLLKAMPQGTVGEIMNGPTNKNGYTWWGIHWLEDNIWGWSVEKYLASASGGSNGGGSSGGGGGGSSLDGQDLLNAAKDYLGAPYVLGDLSSGDCNANSVDCSCLVYLAARDIGLPGWQNLPDDPQKYKNRGSVVQGSPQAGDVLIYENPPDVSGHMGIATGEGGIIHANTYTGDVAIYEDYYRWDNDGYWGAVRIV